MQINEFGNKIIDFDSPIGMPENDEKAKKWQEANQMWWERSPMRYDWKERIPYSEFTAEFYGEIDRRFFEEVRNFMPWKRIPFDSLIDFNSLVQKDVLEIGVGNGGHAQLIARYSRSFVGIDLTDYAVKSTQARMRRFDLNGRIEKMDAEKMSFPDGSFDFILAWGVIHHSSNPRKIIEEMHRVLRPGGQAITMVYHRNFWNYYVAGGLFHGILQGELLRAASIHRIIQNHTDGALARYYTTREWKNLVSPPFKIQNVLIFGQKSELIPLPGGRLKQIILRIIPDNITRFLTNNLRFGSFLVSVLEKNNE